MGLGNDICNLDAFDQSMMFGPIEILRWLPSCTGHIRMSSFYGERGQWRCGLIESPIGHCGDRCSLLGTSVFCRKDPEGCIEVSFEDSNDLKLMDFPYIFFLFDHGVDDRCPSFVYTTVHEE